MTWQSYIDEPGFWGFLGCSSLHRERLQDSSFDNMMALLSFKYLEFSPSPLIEGRECADGNGGFYKPGLEFGYSIDKNSVTRLLLTTRQTRKRSPAMRPWGKGDLFEHIAILCQNSQNRFHCPRVIHYLFFWLTTLGYYILYKDSVRTNERCVSSILPKDFILCMYLLSGA